MAKKAKGETPPVEVVAEEVGSPPVADATQEQVSEITKILDTSKQATDSKLQATEEKDPKPEVQPAIPEPPVFDPAILRQAKEFGYSEEEAKAFGTPDNLYKALSAYNRVKMTQVEPKVPEKKPETRSLKPDLIALDPEIHDQTIISKFNELDGRMIKLTEENESLRTRLQETASSAAEIEFDSAVKGLGARFEKYLGTGPSKSLAPTSLEYKNRLNLAKRLAIQLDSYARLGEVPPPAEEMIHMLAEFSFGKDVKQQVREEMSDSLQKRSAQHIQRPDTAPQTKTDQDFRTQQISTVAEILKRGK